MQGPDDWDGDRSKKNIGENVASYVVDLRSARGTRDAWAGPREQVRSPEVGTEAASLTGIQDSERDEELDAVAGRPQSAIPESRHRLASHEEQDHAGDLIHNSKAC